MRLHLYKNISVKILDFAAGVDLKIDYDLCIVISIVKYLWISNIEPKMLCY